MAIKLRPYSETLHEALKDPHDAAAYLNIAFAEGSESDIMLALRAVADVHGMANVAQRAGLGRESSYKTLSEDGNPKLTTLKSVLHGMGLRLAVVPENNHGNANVAIR